MVAVDSVKTLPLDAVVLQKGYLGQDGSRGWGSETVVSRPEVSAPRS